VVLITYVPVVTFATRKEPVNSPLESEQFAEVTMLPDSVQFESVAEKPEPET
jgi:hypothetical protein